VPAMGVESPGEGVFGTLLRSTHGCKTSPVPAAIGDRILA
jgi:hypothetical protein